MFLFFINVQQVFLGCISFSLLLLFLKFFKGLVEVFFNVYLLQFKFGIQFSVVMWFFLQQLWVELLGQFEMKMQLEQDSIIDVLLLLSMEVKIKQEIIEGEFKVFMIVFSGKKVLVMCKVFYFCCFCNQVFVFLGVLCVYVCFYLGILLYQCNICDYIVVDKVVFICYLCMYSGEWFYICKICYYFFIVKVNCEWYLCKKYFKVICKDIEKNIEYVSSSVVELVDVFCVLDIVCWLCGEDFKYYCVLCIYMCMYCGCGLGGGYKGCKFFECKECSVVFVVKCNCIYYIFKQYLYVFEQDIESYVLVVDSLGFVEVLVIEVLGCGEDSGCVVFGDCKFFIIFLEFQNGFFYRSFIQFLFFYVLIKLEFISSFVVDFNEFLDFFQKGLVLV